MTNKIQNMTSLMTVSYTHLMVFWALTHTLCLLISITKCKHSLKKPYCRMRETFVVKRGCTKKSNQKLIQLFENKVFRSIVNNPWYIKNEDIHRDLKTVSVENDVQQFTTKHESICINTKMSRCCNFSTILNLGEG